MKWYKKIIDYLYTTPRYNAVFHYHTSRLSIGIIAFSLPLIVAFFAGGFFEITSISGSYYTPARDKFVGLLFMVGGFLLAYNGHYIIESVASKAAAVATFGVALFPTACPDNVCASTVCAAPWEVIVHEACAVLLFLLLSYFCLGPFTRRARLKSKEYIEAYRRMRVYQFCGWGILIAMALAALLITLSPNYEALTAPNLIYLVEVVCLFLFGVAWIIAGKYARFTFFVNKEEVSLRVL